MGSDVLSDMNAMVSALSQTLNERFDAISDKLSEVESHVVSVEDRVSVVERIVWQREGSAPEDPSSSARASTSSTTSLKVPPKNNGDTTHQLVASEWSKYGVSLGDAPAASSPSTSPRRSNKDNGEAHERGRGHASKQRVTSLSPPPHTSSRRSDRKTSARRAAKDLRPGSERRFRSRSPTPRSRLKHRGGSDDDDEDDRKAKPRRRGNPRSDAVMRPSHSSTALAGKSTRKSRKHRRKKSQKSTPSKLRNSAREVIPVANSSRAFKGKSS